MFYQLLTDDAVSMQLLLRGVTKSESLPTSHSSNEGPQVLGGAGTCGLHVQGGSKCGPGQASLSVGSS